MASLVLGEHRGLLKVKSKGSGEWHGAIWDTEYMRLFISLFSTTANCALQKYIFYNLIIIPLKDIVRHRY